MINFVHLVVCQIGSTAQSIARRLGYISVVDILKPLTDETLTSSVRPFIFVKAFYKTIFVQSKII